MGDQVDINRVESVNPADGVVVDNGRFAVNTYNVNNRTNFLFVDVLAGFKGSGNEGNYYLLIINTVDGDAVKHTHKAIVLQASVTGAKLINYWQ